MSVGHFITTVKFFKAIVISWFWAGNGPKIILFTGNDVKLKILLYITFESKPTF